MLDLNVPHFVYTQKTGVLDLEEVATTTFLGCGYSGLGRGRNNPSLEAEVGIGPIPRGWYTLHGPFMDYTNDEGHHLGDYVFRLEPDEGNKMFGREDFLIHGNNRTNNASKGCIIQGPAVRIHVNQIFHRGVTRLEVK